jgi:predicted transcriptional regulator
MSGDTTPQSPDEKRKAHFTRAKKAVLKLAADNGGTCAMSEMHTFSESQFFIAHQQFSTMLVECVDDGLVEVDSDNVITLTEKGQAFVNE